MGIAAAWRALWQPRHMRETKASRAGPLLALHMARQPALLPRRYDSFAEEGYRKNVVAFRAVNEVARGMACVPWRLFRRNGRNREELAQHALLSLLQRPNPAMGQSAFFEAVTGFLLIAGNSYIEAAPAGGGAAPRELWPLRPDRMAVIKSRTGLAAGYEYRLGGELRRWPADPISGRAAVLHLKSFHPLDDWYGMSPIEAAAFGIDQHNEAGKWNTALLQNSGRPVRRAGLQAEPAMERTPTRSRDEQFARLDKQLDERA